MNEFESYPEEILEAIRIITFIHYRVKARKSLLEYTRYFKEFKEAGLIQTKLSQINPIKKLLNGDDLYWLC